MTGVAGIAQASADRALLPLYGAFGGWAKRKS